MHYIYTLSDPRDGTVRYVGITLDTGIRYYEHIHNGENSRSNKSLWIEDVIASGLKPVLFTIDTAETREEAQIKEKHWIQYYIKENAPLTNTLNLHIPIHEVDEGMEDALITTEDELKALLKKHGWSLYNRVGSKKNYLYALKWKKDQIPLGSYVGTFSLSMKSVLTKIANGEVA